MTVDMQRTLHITVGILAHNESRLIARTIHSLLQQSVFRGDNVTLADVQWDIVVVPNGCQDDTQRRAEQALQAVRAMPCAQRVSYRVVPLARAGKSRAWNHLAHHLAAPATDVFVMMDADITYIHKDTIANCVQRLRTDPHAWAVVDQPVKWFDATAQKTLVAKVSKGASSTTLQTSSACICGQFYVMAAPRMRSIWMPGDLGVEDGFLQVMVMTDNFRQAPDASRVVRADHASHHYEGLSRLRDIVDHEVRIMTGTVLNAYLCWDVLLFMTPRDGPGAGHTVRQLNTTDPGWYRRMMENQIAIRGRWVVRLAPCGQRLKRWWASPPMQRFIRLPIVLLLSAFDAYVMWQVRRRMLSGNAISHW
jgi:glycosyltransferase involved in cell wall biosynthesis